MREWVSGGVKSERVSFYVKVQSRSRTVVVNFSERISLLFCL